MADMETWKNVAKGPIELIKLDPRGNERGELIEGGRVFTISREERQINQDRCVAADMDWFTNGRLAPVRIPVRILNGDEEDFDLASYPNVIADADLESMFAEHWRTFEKRIAEITNPVTLQRILDLAHDKDATVRQVKTIQDRMKEVDPTAFPEPGEDLGTVKSVIGINKIDLGNL